ncbi:leucine-rich repeat-containing protein 4 [Cimex lectularius]|uniref:Ig-like domain-containing protein n=1 Tax=Cimex lectularius TaxID=79782 RepID=A0A8I6S5W2_CIMLE|nr:leucine-rich repeat-containing protein 4 [Cimex lectularius]
MIIFLFVLVSSFFGASLSGSGNCPPVCVCKWKGGKQTVECTDRALIMIPEGVDSETQVLDMSGNNLQILPREVFVRTGLLNLQRLYLRNCRLGQIDDQALAGLTNLVELDLTNNLLTTIPSATFKDVPFLRDLVMARNPIQKIESHAFKTVPGLVKLDLSNCALQMISPKAFEGVELLEALKLNGNQLHEIRPRTVETLSRLHGVELHDNPWYCDCHLRAAKIWLMDNNIPYPIAPMCKGGPERIVHRTFAELDLDDFACKPEIRLDSRHVEATTGDNATIVCRVASVPEATISWYWNGRLLVNNSAFSSYQRVHIIENGTFDKKSTLIVTNAQEADSGDFYCIAENRAGNAEANYTVHVSYRMAGMASLGSGQIAGLSAALVILILFILLVILVLLVRLRRVPFSESKTPGQLEVVANGNVTQKATTPVTVETSTFVERKETANPVQKPPRVPESPVDYDGLGGVSNPVQFAAPISNPDLINDTREDGRPGSGEYSRMNDGLYPASVWEEGYLGRTPSMDACDRTPIVEHVEDYPPDYGLPIPGGAPPPSAKTLRVWQRGVPVLPPVNALKRVLTRNSPDEGYQEGCGTDV